MSTSGDAWFPPLGLFSFVQAAVCAACLPRPLRRRDADRGANAVSFADYIKNPK
jgi:hypothetical protein